MVGLSDIPCVGVAVDRASNATVDALIRGFTYIFHYSRLLKNLDSEIKKLSIEEEEIAGKVNADRTSGKTIKTRVVDWQQEVENIKKVADGLTGQRPSWSCFSVLQFPNPVSRFRLGRKATHNAEIVAKLYLSGKDLAASQLADLQDGEHMEFIRHVPMPDDTYQKFDSRKEAYGKLWSALLNEEANPILGIHGMAGAGKTKMMEQICKECKDQNIFNKITRANVGSEKFDVINIQNQLAVYLGCHFDSKDDTIERALQLNNSIKNAGKTLVILDDVWDQDNPVDLKEIGISFGDNCFKGCKILFTSRKQSVCLRNKCFDIEVKTLTANEAWDMFKSTVGTDRIESLQDKSLAEKVCKECACLPLLIAAVGNALKILPETSWKGALYQLENSEIQNVPGLESTVDSKIDRSVYGCLKLSFDLLRGDDAKPCILLCSLFPEDAEVQISVLFDIGIASRVLNGAKETLHIAVDDLKSSSLLLEGDNQKLTVKLHDTVRDVARTVAATDPKYAFIFLRGHSRLPNIDDYSDRKLIHFVEKDNVQFPDDLECPNLHTLWLQCNNPCPQISDGFSRVFTKLKVLLLKGMPLTAQQFFIHTSKELKMLVLDACDVDQTFLNNVSKNLETLCINWECNLPSPLELPVLKKLRKLEVLSQTTIEIVPNAISSLCSLEELKLYEVTGLADGFSDDKSYAFANLKVIDIYKCDIEYLARISVDIYPLTFLSNLSVVNIGYCQRLKYLFSASAAKCLVQMQKLIVHNCQVLEEIVRVTGPTTDGEIINFPKLLSLELGYLPSLRSFDNFATSSSVQSYTLFGEMVVFPSLEELYISDLEIREIWKRDYNPKDNSFTGLKFVSITNCRILESAITLHGLQKLEQLNISSCHRLTNVFQNHSMASNLLNLEYIGIMKCDRMTEIIGEGGAYTNTGLVFPAVRRLSLTQLSDLKCFWWCNQSPKSILVSQVTFPNLETLLLSDLKCSLTEEIELGRDDSTSKLRRLILEYVEHEVELPFRWQLQLQDLIQLELKNCWWPGTSLLNSTGTPSFLWLKRLSVHKCRVSTHIFTSSVSRNFPRLESLEISDCPLLEEIVEDVKGDQTDGTILENTILLPQLKYVTLVNLPNLQKNAISDWNMPALKHINVYNCGFSTLFRSSVFKNLQLEDLSVSNCGLLEDLVDDEMVDEILDKSVNTIWLPQMKSLFLQELPSLKTRRISDWNMPALKHIYVNNCGFSTLFRSSIFRNLQKLEKLKVSNCVLLQEIVKDDETFGTSEKPTTLPQLEILLLKNLPNLQNNATPAWNMPALKNVEVDECGFSTLFKSFVPKNLHKIKVSNCASLEQIVDDETPGTSVNTMAFPQLVTLAMKNLPNLKTRGISASNMPALEKLKVYNCGFSTLFRSSVFRNLHEIKVSNCASLDQIVDDEMDDETPGTSVNTMAFPQLVILALKNLPNLKTRGISASNMPALEKLKVDKCPLSILFKSPFFRNLRKLEVSNCALLEEIVEEGRDDIPDNYGSTALLLQLQSLVLEDLPVFKRLCGSANYYSFNMPSVEEVKVRNCGRLSTLFTCSVFGSLQELQKLEVSHCPLLEEIVEDEMDDHIIGRIGKTISLARLKCVSLGNLPSLKNFSLSANYVFNMPALQSVSLSECPEIENFTSLQINKPVVEITDGSKVL